MTQGLNTNIETIHFHLNLKMLHFLVLGPKVWFHMNLIANYIDSCYHMDVSIVYYNDVQKFMILLIFVNIKLIKHNFWHKVMHLLARNSYISILTDFESQIELAIDTHTINM